MGVGQVFAALAFMTSGFIQMMIEDELTPIPDYGEQNSLSVINGVGPRVWKILSFSKLFSFLTSQKLGAL